MYYPKSKVITNLYTNGEELISKLDNKIYIGHYHKLSNGKIFSGKTPEASGKMELELIKNNQIGTDDPNVLFSNDNVVYNSIKKVNINKILKLPKYHHPQPTEDDYKRKNFYRYFVKKINSNYILEVNKDDYNAILNKDNEYLYYLFFPFKILWELGEDKINININRIEEIERNNKIIIKNYFKNKFDLF